MQSGTSICLWSLTRTAREMAFALGARLGIFTADTRELVEELRKVDYHRLKRAENDVFYVVSRNLKQWEFVGRFTTSQSFQNPCYMLKFQNCERKKIALTAFLRSSRGKLKENSNVSLNCIQPSMAVAAWQFRVLTSNVRQVGKIAVFPQKSHFRKKKHHKSVNGNILFEGVNIWPHRDAKIVDIFEIFWEPKVNILSHSR